MKTLIIGDPHGKLPVGLSKIIKKNKIELIIVTGEIPCVPMENFAPRKLKEFGYCYADKNYKKLLNKICSYKIPVIALRGNSYSISSHDRLVSKWFKKHKNLYYKRTGIIKINGKNFVLFDHIWEEWAYKWVKRVYAHNRQSRSKERIKKLNKLMKETENPIFVTHCPPYGYLDKVPKIGSVGSKVILKVVKKYQPKYVFCGHIHEGRGKIKIGKTQVINAGFRGDYFILDIK